MTSLVFCLHLTHDLSYIMTCLQTDFKIIKLWTTDGNGLLQELATSQWNCNNHLIEQCFYYGMTGVNRWGMHITVNTGNSSRHQADTGLLHQKVQHQTKSQIRKHLFKYKTVHVTSASCCLIWMKCTDANPNTGNNTIRHISMPGRWWDAETVKKLSDWQKSCSSTFFFFRKTLFSSFYQTFDEGGRQTSNLWETLVFNEVREFHANLRHTS